MTFIRGSCIIWFSSVVLRDLTLQMCLLWWMVDKLAIRLRSALPPVPCWHISEALLWRLNHIRSLMSVSGCICKVIKITALIKPQVTAYCLDPKFGGEKRKKKKKESGFNNRKTACVTFDPVSINAGETEVLLPAFYLKQRVFGREVLPMQSSWVSFARLLLILAKVSMWILSVCLKWSTMNEKSIITTFLMQRGFPATYGNYMICPLLARRSRLEFRTRSAAHYRTQQPQFYELHSSVWDG